MTEIPVPDPNKPAPKPPDVISSGTRGLAPGQQLRVRTAKPSKNNIELNPEDIVSAQMPTPGEITSARAREIAGPTSFGYVGTNLVGADGSITRGQYDAKGEAFSELAKFADSATRLAFLKSLKDRNLYGSSKVSTTGLDTQDLAAMEVFLNFANVQGVTSEVAFSQLQTMYPASGGGRAIRTTPKADIRAVFRTTTRQLLGRDLPPDAIEKFVQAYEGKEITEGGGGVKAPTIGNAAEEAVQQQFGGEANAMGMANLMDLMDRKIKGLA
jgi:hypothetical protein